MYKPTITHHHIKKDYKRGMTPEKFYEQFLLTLDTHVHSFDDGLAEGYTVAFPLLKSCKRVGYFFPIGETLVGRVNHVHKGHVLLDHLEEELIDLWNKVSDQQFTEEFTNIGKYSLDTPRIAAFKMWLYLRVSIKQKNLVFDEIMEAKDIQIVPEEYYMTAEELKEMHEAGMVIGNHTHIHLPLALYASDAQYTDILAAQGVIRKAIGEQPTVFSYPYGSYNQDTLEILREQGYRLGFTTDSLLEVGRIDCKDESL